MKKFNDFLQIKEAAEFLGVCQNTLRIWDSQKKIRTFRHPINEYRLFDKKDLIEILHKINSPQ